MKKIVLFVLALVLCFSGCTQKREEEIGQKAKILCGTVEENVYKNELFGISFEIPENWEEEEPDPSEDSRVFMDDWYFGEKDGMGSLDMYMGYMTEVTTEEETFEYIYNLTDEIYGEAIVEKTAETVVIDEKEKNFVLIHAIDGDFECYIGVLGTVAEYEDENWLMWSCFLFETEEKVISAIETVFSGTVKTQAEESEEKPVEKIIPAGGNFDGKIFENEVFGLGFVVPSLWECEPPEKLPTEETESFWDWDFYSPYGYGGFKVMYKSFTNEIEVTHEEMVELGTRMDFEESRIDTVFVDGKETDCVFGKSGGEYSLYIPKIIRDSEGGWAYAVLITGESEEILLEYAERLTFDVENIKELERKVNKDYEFNFVPGKLKNGKFCNEFTGICFTTPKGWEYVPEEELYRENDEYGYFEDVYCVGKGVDTVLINYNKYNTYGGKAAAKENLFSQRWYLDDNEYGIVFVSEEINIIEHCGKEISQKREVYDFGEGMVYFDTFFVEKDKYAIVITTASTDENGFKEMLSYIDLNYNKL